MKQRDFILLAFTLCSIIDAHAQSTQLNNNVVSQAPQVASLMKFTETPVSYFNGTANVSVPLYEIKSGNLDYPITLNYNTSGIKVAEEAGIVGLGWNISTNAAIVDPIGNGNNPYKSDVAPTSITGPPSQSYAGESNMIFSGEVFKNQQAVCTAFPQFQYLGTLANNDPDMRILSANGISAKFITPNGYGPNNWVSIDGQNIKLNQNGGTYTALMPDGTQYNFNDYVQASSFQSGQTYTSTTYLTSIISTTGKAIRFYYINPPSSFQPVIVSRVQSWMRDNIFSTGDGLSDVFNYSALTEKFLSEIDFDNGKVLFNYISRDDMASYKLSTITIWRTGDSSPFKTITFNYDDFSYPEGAYGDFTDDLQTVSGVIQTVATELATQPYRQNRLRLLSVQVNNDAPYGFTYDNTPMPFKTSWAQDIWGYFNGNTIKSLLPNYNYLPFTGNQIPISILTDAEQGVQLFSDRSAHFNFAKAGVLNSITYPTGGYTTFQYQPNTFGLYQGAANIVDTLVSVGAIGNGAQVQEFNIPDVGLMDANFNVVNPAMITLRLFCGSLGGTGDCDYSTVGQPGGCGGYYYGTGVQPLDAINAGGLWAEIQVRDASGNWGSPANFTSDTYSENIFDWHNTDIGTTSCTLGNMPKNLPPGHYRIIANYPNSLPNGAIGGPWAFISVSFKTRQTTVPNNTGPGLRVSTITDYAAGGQVALTRNITYAGGQLMTQPIFYRYLTGEVHNITSEPVCATGSTLWGQTAVCDPASNGCSCFSPVIIPRTVAIVYSDPVVPYSYSANGSLFGYSTVYEQKVDGQGNDQGRTVYTFNCKPDNYTFWGWDLPGTRSNSFLDNGKLVGLQEQKNVGGQYQTIHSTHYDYNIGNPALYWGFKVEYRPNYVTCSGIQAGDPIISGSRNAVTGNWADTKIGTLTSSGSIGPQDNSYNSNGGFNPMDGNQFLFFYPIRTGHVNISDKIDSTFDSATPHIVTTNYTYNLFNQQSTSSTVESDGKTHATQTYYPGDYSAGSGDFTTIMQGLNMLNYPVENISTVNGLAVSASYIKYSSHDNMVTPLTGYALNSVVPVLVTPSSPSNLVMDSHYQPRVNFTYDSHGSLIQQQKVGGPLYNYLWDYSNDLPTAAIINATANDFAYTSFESGSTGNWAYSGTRMLDGTTPLGQYSYNLASGAISASNMLPAKTYNLSYWTNASNSYTIAGTISGYPITLRTLNGWTNYLHKVTGVTGVSISGAGSIDDLHLFPSDGQMSTYIYDPLIGMTAATDTRGNTVYYDYDNNERLTDAKDLNKNIIKAYAYSFAGWPGGSSVGSYTSAAASRTIYANNCGFGYNGGPVLYTVQPGLYSSYISQADADAKAQDDINRNGQNYANQIGGCNVAPCSAGSITATGQNLNYTVTYGSSVVLAGVVLLVITDSSGNQVHQTVLTTSGGTTSGTVSAHGTYNFTLQVQGEYCPTPVKAPAQQLSL